MTQIEKTTRLFFICFLDFDHHSVLGHNALMGSPSEFNPKEIIPTIPTKPGVYRMLGSQGEILYVGKAKHLRNRVRSYFRGNIANARTYALVKQIQGIEITVTHTEAEAFLLENNLIKRYKPRYNILLKDGKGYPYIRLTDRHQHPGVYFYRGKRSLAGKFFGPYPNATAVRHTLQLLKKMFLVRQCEDSFYANRSRPCLDYQIKRCTGPCVGAVSDVDYAKQVALLTQFLQGDTAEVIDQMVAAMEASAAEQDYEAAAGYRDQIEQLRQISQQQSVTHGSKDLDVVALYFDGGLACLQVFSIRGGQILGNRNVFPSLPQGVDDEAEILTYSLSQYYLQHPTPAEVLIEYPLEDQDMLGEMLSLKEGHKVRLSVAQRGQRKQWMVMAKENTVQAHHMRNLSKASMLAKLQDLQTELGLDVLPKRMECWDVSHTMGEATVASCVVFDANGPLKSDYRRYNIQGITSGDDYAAMNQALTRRFAKLDLDQAHLPDVLFIDGGKGQLSQAYEVLAAVNLSLFVVGVVKGEGRKQAFDNLLLPNGQRLALPSHSKALHLVQQLRDEAHRFAIAGHRARRQKSRTRSPLEAISGLGPKRRRELLKQFGGMRAIQRASVQELAKVSGISLGLAQKIYDQFHGAA